MTRSSTPHAPLGKSSSLNPKRSPPSECAIGLMSVSHYDPWYYVVVSEIVATGTRRADPTHGARQEAARGIAHHERQPPSAAVGANNAKTLDVMKTGIVGAVLAKGEADAGQKNLVDESFEDRRKSHVPDWERKHDRFGGQKPINIGHDIATVDRHVVVVDPILPRHHRIEALRIEIAIVDLVPLRAQDLEDFRVQGCGET